MDGRESPMAKEARRVAERLAAACEVPVEMHDERLTSVAAEERLAARGWSLKRLLEEKKKGAVDRLAAQILLEDWLTRHGGAPA
jgi:putative Holliday junction resolvase